MPWHGISSTSVHPVREVERRSDVDATLLLKEIISTDILNCHVSIRYDKSGGGESWPFW